jgi:hypothetical protein
MKYKICRFQDANGLEWYQIKVKWWIFWYNYETPDYSNYDCAFWELSGDRFTSKEYAQKKIDQLIQQNNSQKIRLLECAEV